MARKSNPRNQQARREQILLAAANVFGERGFSRATIRQIAAAAGISEGLVYTYFKSKGELLVAMLNELTAASAASVSGEASLAAMVSAQVSQTLARPRVNNAMFAAVMAEVMINPDLRQVYREERLLKSMAQFKEFLEKRMRAGEIPDQDLDIVTRACFALVMGLGLLRVIGDPLLQPDQAGIQGRADSISRFVLKALS